MRLALFVGPRLCRYALYVPNSDPEEAYNCLFAMYFAYIGLSEDRKAKLLEDPKFQYIIHESNIVIAKRFKFDKMENVVESRRLEELLVEMRQTLNLPTDITDDEYDLVLGLRNQVASEMEHLSKTPEKIVGSVKLMADSSEIYEINERVRKESLKKPLKVGI